MGLIPCPRRFCGGTLIPAWGYECLLCGRSPVTSPTVGPVPRRRPPARRAPRADPYLAVARKVLGTGPGPIWDPGLRAFVIDTLD